MRFLYNFIIRLYLVAVRVAAAFQPKARLWIRGRKNLFSDLEVFAKQKEPTAWFHCASLGEFEQGRPVLEAYKKHHPDHRILLTFFSPSGYEVRKNYQLANHVCYLPADTPFNARHFVSLINPTMVVFVKYEYWLNFIREITSREIPFYILSANFRPGQFFFSWYGHWFLKYLRMVTHFFVQTRDSATLLYQHGIKQVTVAGDTRFDRVSAIAAEQASLMVVEEFVSGPAEIIVAGSTWPADEDLLGKLFTDNQGKLKLIIAPHEIHEAHLKALEKQFEGQTIRYSTALQTGSTGKRVLILDSIGMLSKLYRYGRYAYIGGGFGVGIHNILEAAVYGVPVIFGPNHHKFREALDLIASGGAFSISDFPQLSSLFRELSENPAKWQQSANAAKVYVSQRRGATEQVMEFLR